MPGVMVGKPRVERSQRITRQVEGIDCQYPFSQMGQYSPILSLTQELAIGTERNIAPATVASPASHHYVECPIRSAVSHRKKVVLCGANLVRELPIAIDAAVVLKS